MTQYIDYPDGSHSPLTFTVGFGKRLMLFICITVFCFAVTSVLLYVGRDTLNTTPGLRITSVFQSLLVFMAPALATAVIVTRRPAELLLADRMPRTKQVIWMLLAIVCAVPFLNWVIAVNARVALPEELEMMELAATETITKMFGDPTDGSLAIMLMIVGVIAPLAEELYFRGALQRLFTTAGWNIHAAIWFVAAVFSAMHMEFHGFVPRMLLGAFFGYTMYWSRSVWLAVFAHMTNNIISCVDMWLRMRDGLPVEPELPELPEAWLVGLSAGFASFMIFMLAHTRTPHPTHTEEHRQEH